MIKLAASRDGALRPALPQDRDAATWHRVLTAEIAAHLTPAHAALLAEPVPDEGGTTWLAPGSAMRRFADLSLEDRNRLTAAATAILLRPKWSPKATDFVPPTAIPPAGLPQAPAHQ